MTSFQSTLGEDDVGVAEELAESQRQISIAEFFERNKHMLGFDSEARALVTAVKEGVDNALDATEEAGILPDVYVEITETDGYYRLVIEDNGPGITAEQVPKVFGKLLYGSRFHKREQNRGQQGIGISAAVLYAQLTSGKPARITSRTKGGDTARQFEITIDTDTNEPEIETDEAVSWDRPHGTRIELELEGNMRARQQLHQYVEQTAVVNPHARIELREPDAHFKFERATDELPAETEEIRPHPHGVELGTLQKLLEATDSYSISGFLQSEFTRVGAKTADSVVEAFLDRHVGRELSWRAPRRDERTDLARAVTNAVANKSSAATAAFADRVADDLVDADRVTHGNVVDVVAAAADAVAEEHGETFGDTVRANAVDAAWETLTAHGEETDRLTPDLYAVIDDATTARKDDAALEGLADRLADRIDGLDDPRHRLTREALRDLVDRAADMTEEHDDANFGETARENVTDAIWSTTGVVPEDPPSVSAVAGDRDTAAELLEAMRATDILAPPTGCLAPIEADLVEAGLRKEYDAEFYAAATRDAEVHGGDPFVVEAGVAYGGEIEAEGSIDLLRFANRVPLVYQRGACATTDVVTDVNWRNYGLDQTGGSGIPEGPAVLLVHVASTNVPFTSESKDAVAAVPEIEDEIELAVREVGRELKSHLKERRSREQRRRKQEVIADILPEMARKVSDLTDREPVSVDRSLARIMNNVHVERRADDGTARITVSNHGDRSADLEVTDILTAEPAGVDGADVVEMDGEYFLTWEPSVPAGETATLEYSLDADADDDLSVSGVPDERLTVDS